MDKYNVTGMTCSACSARVEKAVSNVEGVTSCQVNLLTNSMMVDGTADSGIIVAAVEKAGYGASLAGGRSAGGNTSHSGGKSSGSGESEADKEFGKMKKRLVASVIILIPLMYISMGHMMWNWPLPSFFDGNHVAMGLTQMLLTIIVMVINQRFFVSGFKGAIHGSPNMDTLVAMGSGASFIYSVYVLYAMTAAQTAGDGERVITLMHDFYFESAAMILALITVGKTLEAYSKGRTTDALKGLMDLAPKTAVLIRDGEEVTVDIDEVAVGDIFAVRPGESVPVDGVVLEGDSAVDESALSGESIPVDKTAGSRVSAATINQSGYLKCRATQVGADTALSKIIDMVSDAAATKAPIAKLADKVSGVFVPVVILIAFITMIVWIIVGKDAGYVLARGISVLVISCPCALGLATPVAIMVGTGRGAQLGVLYKNAQALENLHRVDTVVLDKTGTLTTGQPEVTDVFPGKAGRDELLRIAAILESRSEHPFAGAILRATGKPEQEPENFETIPGRGVAATVDGTRYYGGNRRLMESVHVAVSEYPELSCQGKTPLYFAGEDGTYLGAIAAADVLKPDSRAAVAALHRQNLDVVMLTGDNAGTAHAIAEKAGITSVIADVLPQDKAGAIKSLQAKGHKVLMVGDGINDAPALKNADVGIAMGISGTEVSKEASDIVLLDDSFATIVKAVEWGRNIYENFKRFISFQLTVNIASVICVFVSVLMGLPAPFTALQLLWDSLRGAAA